MKTSETCMLLWKSWQREAEIFGLRFQNDELNYNDSWIEADIVLPITDLYCAKALKEMDGELFEAIKDFPVNQNKEFRAELLISFLKTKTLFNDPQANIVFDKMNIALQQEELPENIVILYGAGHMANIEHRIFTELQGRLEKEEWLTNFDYSADR